MTPPFDEPLMAALTHDNINVVRRISIEDLQKMLLPPPNKLVNRLPPLHYAVMQNSTQCVKYLLTIPDINVNIEIHQDPSSNIMITPFMIAINNMLAKMNTEINTKMSQILARDSRTNVNIMTTGFIGTLPAIFAVEMLTKMKNLPTNKLLLDIMRNRTLNVNQTLPLELRGANTLALFINSITNETKDEFMALVGHPDLDLSYQCRRSFTALHYAVERSVPFAAAKLLEVMSVRDINMRNNAGNRAYSVKPENDGEGIHHAQILEHFLKCPAVKIEPCLLGNYIVDGMYCYQRSGSANHVGFATYIDIIDALLAHPNFSMMDVVNVPMNKLNAFNEARDWPDESMMMKLLTHKQMNDELLMSGNDGKTNFLEKLLHMVVQMPYALPLVKQLVKFAPVRDQIVTIMSSAEDNVGEDNIIDYILKTDNVTLLRVLLDTITANDNETFVQPMEWLRERAEMMGARRCLRLLNKYGRTWMTKVKVVEYGHIFECC